MFSWNGLKALIDANSVLLKEMTEGNGFMSTFEALITRRRANFLAKHSLLRS